MADRVLVTHPLPGGLDLLDGLDVVHPVQPPERSQLIDLVVDVEAIVCPLTVSIDAELLQVAEALQIVANVAVGYDNIDVAAATRKGVLVTNTPGVLDETTADLAFALFLAACRVLSDAERDLRAGRWEGWALDQYLGVDVHGSTLGLIGYGRIARAVARRARGFDMEVLHHTRTETDEPGYVADLGDLLRRSDIVSLHVPLTDETHHLIGARELDLMGPTAVLVNTARGPVIDEDALADALEDGRLFAAGLDVHEDEPTVNPRLLDAPRTVLLPHIGSASRATRTRMAGIAMTSVRTALGGGVPETAVNPEAQRTDG